MLTARSQDEFYEAMNTSGEKTMDPTPQQWAEHQSLMAAAESEAAAMAKRLPEEVRKLLVDAAARLYLCADAPEPNRERCVLLANRIYDALENDAKEPPHAG